MTAFCYDLRIFRSISVQVQRCYRRIHGKLPEEPPKSLTRGLHGPYAFKYGMTRSLDATLKVASNATLTW